MSTPQKLRCQVNKITDHGDHVYTVDLAPERPVPSFKPGQFLHLTLDNYDPSGFWPESRVFSIASSPAQRNDLRIAYSVRGRYTARMENELQEGQWVWVKLPYGDFVIRDANNVALLAGGTGITAFIDGLTDEFHNNIFLAYGARKPELLLYRDLIDAKAGTDNGFHASYFVETEDKNKSGSTKGQSPEFFTGCLSLEAIWNQLKNPREAIYYIAGPPRDDSSLDRKLAEERNFTGNDQSGCLGVNMEKDKKNIPVVILCGGMGTRLREETEYKPKPMVEIGGKPVLWHIMKIYAHFGFRRFILCLGYKGSVIKEYFLNYEAMSNDFTINLGKGNRLAYQSNHTEQDFNVTLVDTGLATMTGGRVKRIEKFIDTDTFMVTYGDGLANINIDDLFAFHQKHGKLATLTAARPPSRFGILELSEDDRVKQFREKVQTEWIHGGFMVFNRRLFDYLDEDCFLEREPMEKITAEKQMMAFRHEGFWIGMDTYREYEMLNQMWDLGKAEWKVW